MPQHDNQACCAIAQYFLAPDHSYLEIDLDVHSYAYLARKAFHAFIPRLSTVIFENGFVIQVMEQQLQALPNSVVLAAQGSVLSWAAVCPAHHADDIACAAQGNSNEELPEVILGCARVSRIDFAQVRTGPDPYAGSVLECTLASGPETWCAAR